MQHDRARPHHVLCSASIHVYIHLQVLFGCAHAGRKLSEIVLLPFGDSNTAILKQSNKVDNKQGAFFGECVERISVS